MRKMDSEGPYTKTSTWKPSYVDEMTDDKVAGEGPYRIVTYQACEPWKRLVVVGPSIRFGENGMPPNFGELVDLLNTAHAEGRKAERERCLAIAENEHADLMECSTSRIIADKIRGGKDEK